MQPLADSILVNIIKAAQHHDSAAFDQLYAHYTDALYRYIYARCGDTAAAEELLGDLWLRVVERIAGFRMPAQGAEVAFTAWLYQIARNLVIDRYRRHKHPVTALDDGWESRDPAVAEEIERREHHRALQEALNTLTPDQREIVVLRFYEERTSSEVARLTGRSETAVKALQHRALGALARVLGAWRHVER
jgi:RNA polymerase sigma-70 factor (ECF subfamily)